MEERKTTQSEVLLAVLERLQTVVDGLNQVNCFLALDPVPPEFPAQSRFATVSPTDGSFDDGMLDGGGELQTLEQTGVSITLFYRTASDMLKSDVNLLTQEAEGLLEQKRQILKAFTNHDLEVNGRKLLAEPMRPIHAANPMKESDLRKNRIGFLQLTFSTQFLWDLTS